MPIPTLRRTRRQPLALGQSFVNAVKQRFGVFRQSHDPPKVSPQVSMPPESRSMRHRSKISSRRRCYIHALPDELLMYIFAMGAQDDVMFAVTASQVCGVWREVALHASFLWRHITLDHRVDMWQERIRRARGCQLDIRLTSPSHRLHAQRWNFHTIQWAMQPALPYIRQWRSLDISAHTPTPFMWNAALSALCAENGRVAAYTLEELSLIYPANDDSKIFTLFDGVAPRLLRITLHGIRLDWSRSIAANIHYLDYTHHGFTHGAEAVAEVLEMLYTAPRLQELRLTFPPARPHQSPSRVALPSRQSHLLRCRLILHELRRLRITATGRQIHPDLAQLCVYLSAPGLQTLQLRDAKRSARPFATLETFTQALHGLSPRRWLHVEDGWVDRHFVLALVRASPGLKELTVAPYMREVVEVELPSAQEGISRRWLNHFGRSWPSRGRSRSER